MNGHSTGDDTVSPGVSRESGKSWMLQEFRGRDTNSHGVPRVVPESNSEVSRACCFDRGSLAMI
jgi:hypothetical protein